MIVSLTRYTARLALRVKNLLDRGQLIDWRHLQLIIAPPSDKRFECGGGSPWILCGCWPYSPTGVDIANPPPPDFPAFVLDAFETDDEGRIVFLLDHRFHTLPFGRYMGILRVHPHTPPINAVRPQPGPPPPKPCSNGVVVPPGYGIGFPSQVRYGPHGRDYCEPCPVPPPPPPKCCTLAEFDIELGPECAQHMVDQCVLTFERTDCGEET